MSSRGTKRESLADGWAYHSTKSSNLASIRKYGLTPGAASDRGDRYSEYDDGEHVFFFDDEASMDDYYGDVRLRFPRPSDAKRNQNVYGRALPGFVTRKTVRPQDIWVLLGAAWVPLLVEQLNDLLDRLEG